MSDKLSQEKDEESAILLDLDDDGANTENSKNIHIDADDEMLLLSSSPSSAEEEEEEGGADDKDDVASKPGPSGLSTQSTSDLKPLQATDINSSSVVSIEDSDSEGESLQDSVEVIGSEEDEDSEEVLNSEESDSESCRTDSSFLDGKVQIFMAQGNFFVWNADDVQMLREECRIVGKLVGCLPRAPRQNNQLGLPLQLMPEEAKFLEDIEAACVVEEVEAPQDSAELRKTAFEAMRENNYKAQQVLYKESRKEEVKQHKQVIIQGRKAKKRKMEELQDNKDAAEKSKMVKVDGTEIPDLEVEKIDHDDDTQRGTDEKKLHGTVGIPGKFSVVEKETKDELANEDEESGKVAENCGAGNNPEQDGKTSSHEDSVTVGKESSGSDASPKKTVGGKEEGSKNVDESKEDCMIVSEDNDDIVDDEDEEFDVDDIVSSETHIKHSLVQLFTENPWKESVKRPKNWIFPLSQKELLRYEVFRDLWKRGYYLTSGSKFGGDFLVYPGDPARFHSHHIAVCVDKTVDLSALDIISLGRLGSNVRKTVLLCAFNKLRQIRYTSLQWTGVK